MKKTTLFILLPAWLSSGLKGRVDSTTQIQRIFDSKSVLGKGSQARVTSKTVFFKLAAGDPEFSSFSVRSGDVFPAVLLFMLLIWGCTDLGTDPKRKDESRSVSFSETIQPVFTSSCALQGCHVPGHTTGLDLSEGKSYNNLVDVTSFGYSPLKRVKPGDAANSVLYLKVTGDPTTGDRMPLGGSLGESEINSIKTWIEDGAKND